MRPHQPASESAQRRLRARRSRAPRDGGRRVAPLTVIALVDTSAGVFEVDLETGDVEPSVAEVERVPLGLNLPRVVDSAAAGATVVALVAAKPPLLVSHDAGATWRESGRGLPTGFAVAVAAADPDTIVFAARNRLYVSRDGGVFWTAVGAELPDISAVDISG